MNYEFPSRRSIGDAFPLVSDICGVRRLRRGFHYSLHGTSRRERPNKGHLHAAKKMCPLSESTANRRWDNFSKTLFEMLRRNPSECAMCGFDATDTPSQFPLRSLSLHYHHNRAFTLALPRRLRKMCSLPFLPSVASVHPTNDLNRPHSQLSKK